MVISKQFPNQSSAYNWIKQDNKARGYHYINFGVGNDMQSPYYLYSGVNSYKYNPDGLSGDLIICMFS